MIDPLGFLLATVRDDAGVAALSTRIRAGEPAGGDATVPFQRFVVLVRLGASRNRNTHVQKVRIAARCYGSTYQDAAALYGAVSDAVHAIGPRISAEGVAIWNSWDDTGMGAEKDPDTGQPHEDLIVEVIAGTHLVRIALVGSSVGAASSAAVLTAQIRLAGTSAGAASSAAALT
jgi:hypothetical protein